MVDLESTEGENLKSDTNTSPAVQHRKQEPYKDISVPWKISQAMQIQGAGTMKLLRDSWNIFGEMSLRDRADDVLCQPEWVGALITTCSMQSDVYLHA